MAEVYQNAALTISATGAVDSKAGLFQTVAKRTLFASVPLGEGLYGRETNLDNHWHPKAISVVHAVPGTLENSSEIHPEPLFRRAWTLQEWTLSPGIAHFATGELLCECLTAQGCECQGARLKPQRGDFQALPRDLDSFCSGRNWETLVSIFTRRQITYDSDRLPALSGIAKLLATRRPPGDRYIAGLWTSEMPLALLWERDLGDSLMTIPNPSRPAGYYAPSWSWVSVIGSVRRLRRGALLFIHGAAQIHCQVLGISRGLANPRNPYGSLCYASLKLNGMLVNVGDISTSRFGLLSVGREIDKEIITEYHERVDITFVSDVWKPYDENNRIVFCDVIFFPILSSRNGTHWEGLALRLVDSGGRIDRYTRIGTLALDTDACDAWLEDFGASRETFVIV